MSDPVSSAQYFPWQGGAIFVGTAGVLPAHAHQAIQVCFLFDGHIRLRPNDEDPWTDYDLGIVPSQHPHAMDGSKIHYGATLFVEPDVVVEAANRLSDAQAAESRVFGGLPRLLRVRHRDQSVLGEPADSLDIAVALARKAIDGFRTAH